MFLGFKLNNLIIDNLFFAMCNGMLKSFFEFNSRSYLYFFLRNSIFSFQILYS